MYPSDNYIYTMQLNLFGDQESASPKKKPLVVIKKQPEKTVEKVSEIKEKKPGKRGRKSLKEAVEDASLLSIPDDEELFQKQYYPIALVAEWFHTTHSQIRYWENEFEILKPKKNKKGDRHFRPEDVKNLRLIYYLIRQQKFSIEGARQYLKDHHKKAEGDLQIVECLNRCKHFLLEVRAALQG